MNFSTPCKLCDVTICTNFNSVPRFNNCVQKIYLTSTNLTTPLDLNTFWVEKLWYYVSVSFDYYSSQDQFVTFQLERSKNLTKNDAFALRYHNETFKIHSYELIRYLSGLHFEITYICSKIIDSEILIMNKYVCKFFS